MAVTIKSGATSDEATVDPTSKAVRVTMYDPDGTVLSSIQNTYRAATDPTVAAAASNTAPFFVFYGSGTTTIFVRKIRISGPTTGTLAIQGFTVRKYSTQPSAGTPVALTQIPSDSAFPAPTAALCQVYTAAPTAGTSIGAIASLRMLNKSTTAVDGSEMTEHTFIFGEAEDSSPLVLRGVNQGIGVLLHIATATTVSVAIEWTEV